MVLTVHVPAWQLEEELAVLSVGDTLDTWLRLEESSWPGHPPERIHRLSGVARAIPSWDGAGLGTHPTAIVSGDATVHWDAPRPVTGPVEVVGVVSTTDIDAPDGFPTTRGVVLRARMEWQHYRLGEDRVRRLVVGLSRYEDVRSTYLPPPEPDRPPARPGTIEAVWAGVLVDLDVPGHVSS